MKGHQRIAAGLSQRDLYDHDRTEYHLDENGRPMSIQEVEDLIRENDDRAPIVTKHRFKQPIPMEDYYSQQVTHSRVHSARSDRLRGLARSGWEDRQQRPDESNLEFQKRVNDSLMY